MSGKALYRGLRDILFCGLFIIMIGFSPLWAQITEYPAPFVSLSAIAAGPDGAMWFSGRGNIGRITTAGVVTSYPIPTSGAGSEGITAGPDGAMWFTESGTNGGAPFAKIGRTTTKGVKFTEYALPDPNSIPTAITAGPDGALWFIESGNGNIGRITTSGTITEIPLPASVLNFVRHHRRS
jgi:virginiamycin B lyase